MKRLSRLLPVIAAALALQSMSAFAQEAPVVKSARILEALTAKDIVLDSAPRATGQRPAARPRAGSIDLQVQFAFNSADLLPIGQMQLDELAIALADRAVLADGFELTGHTDRVGDAEYNLRLSLERAVAVRNYLVMRHGVNPARLVTTGLGYSRLADPANPGAAVNRRVEVRRVALLPGYATTAPLVPATHVPAAIVPASTGGRLVPTPQ